MDTANSHKETNRTKHIARRYHYAVCFAQMIGDMILFKLPAVRNPADSMTKVLFVAHVLDETAAYYQAEVDP
jgi:hypothetical protein